MSDYEYRDAAVGVGIKIRDISIAYEQRASIALATDKGDRIGAHLPAAERQAAAQALAGDGYEVVPKLAEWERELLAKQQAGYDIETAQRDLRRIMAELGMSLHARTESSHEVVIREVLPRIRELKTAEPNRPPAIDPADVKVGDVVSVEADDGAWLVRGEVGFSDQDFMIALPFIDPGVWPDLTDATVRLVRRAEPEVDPEQVEALADVLIKVDFDADTNETWLARELVRRGVTVRKER